MRTFTAADAKNKFGELIDMARAAPVAITKYDRPVVVVMAMEEYERLKGRKIRNFLGPPSRVQQGEHATKTRAKT